MSEASERLLTFLNDGASAYYRADSKATLSKDIRIVLAELDALRNPWVTDRPPTEADTHGDASLCVEVTYRNGLLGWEPYYQMCGWKQIASNPIVAWRRIGLAFVPSGPLANNEAAAGGD